MQDLAVRYGGRRPTDAELAGELHCFRHGECSLGAMLASVMSRTGAHPAADVEPEFRARCLSLVAEVTVPMPDAARLFDELEARGIPNGILTNGWSELQRAKAAAVGYARPVIVSEEIGFWKPDRRAFLSACETLGFDVSSTVYVGDSPESDIAGSKSAGMIACWADLESKRYPKSCVAPDHTVTRLPDVLAFLS